MSVAHDLPPQVAIPEKARRRRSLQLVSGPSVIAPARPRGARVVIPAPVAAPGSSVTTVPAVVATPSVDVPVTRLRVETGRAVVLGNPTALVGSSPRYAAVSFVAEPLLGSEAEGLPAVRRHAARLTRRGRLVLAVLSGVAVLGIIAVAHASVPSSGQHAVSPAVGTQLTVQPGDTLWSIATQAYPGADPRVVVDRLRSLNHLGSPAVVPGQVLLLK